ncbi:MAG: DUF6166 domain-containing protein [Verrucomicrobiota bacterium]
MGTLSAPAGWDRSYHGERNLDRASEVWIEEGKPGRAPSRSSLPFHLELRNHSPTGFAWGYGGSGPAQLALALLMDALGDAELALKHYQDFKWQVVADWHGRWSISAKEIREFVAGRNAEGN